MTNDHLALVDVDSSNAPSIAQQTAAIDETSELVRAALALLAGRKVSVGRVDVEVAHDLAEAFVRARDRASALDLNLEAAFGPALIRVVDRALDRALDLDRALEVLTDAAAESAERLRHRRALLLEGWVPGRTSSARRRPPGQVCRRLLRRAVRLLPAEHRDRYDTEWRGELWELPRPARLPYALRLLLQTREMRRALAFVPADGLEQQAPWGRS